MPHSDEVNINMSPCKTIANEHPPVKRIHFSYTVTMCHVWLIKLKLVYILCYCSDKTWSFLVVMSGDGDFTFLCSGTW
jgi:hypothetical protein